MNQSAPYRAMYQSPKVAGEYLRLLRAMDDATLLRCYHNPTQHMQKHHLDMVEGVLNDRGIAV